MKAIPVAMSIALLLIPLTSGGVAGDVKADDGAATESATAAVAPKKASIDWKEVDAKDFAAKLDAAGAAGEKWAASPESIILEYAGPFITKNGEKMGTSRVIRIFTRGEEVPKILNILLVDDGLYDDSVKTSRKRLALTRTDDGKWKVRKAFRSESKWPRPTE